jgi:hypothetical protein
MRKVYIKVVRIQRKGLESAAKGELQRAGYLPDTVGRQVQRREEST